MAETDPPASAGPTDSAATPPQELKPAEPPAPEAPVAAAPTAAAPSDSAGPVASADSAVGSVVGTTDAEKAALGAAAAHDDVLAQASFEDASSVVPDGSAPNAEEFKLPSFQQVMADAQVSSIDLLRDVELNVKIELGRSRMMVEDVLKLNEGSVVELDKLAGDPVDVFVNDRLVARGEVLVLNDNFCVRVNEIVAGVKEEGL